ncbi:MAG: hypothetical protein ABWX90_02760, partial [Candidatus Saccharimonadales bacterium]
RLAMLRERLANTIDYFSIDLLARTLFSPFRQISAGKVNGPIGVIIHAFLDRLISRMIGAMVRSTMIIVGVMAIILHSVIGIISLTVWALIPLFPLIGLVLFGLGWVPWSL